MFLTCVYSNTDFKPFSSYELEKYVYNLKCKSPRVRALSSSQRVKTMMTKTARGIERGGVRLKRSTGFPFGILQDRSKARRKVLFKTSSAAESMIWY
jgi:hypothetical protein